MGRQPHIIKEKTLSTERPPLYKNGPTAIIKIWKTLPSNFILTRLIQKPKFRIKHPSSVESVTPIFLFKKILAFSIKFDFLKNLWYNIYIK